MNTDTPVIIERVGNGYQVRPMYGAGDSVCLTDVLVFQDMGYAGAARDHQKITDTLLGWIEAHFTEGTK